MLKTSIRIFFFFLLAFAPTFGVAGAAENAGPGADASPGSPPSYASFLKGASLEPGLIPIVRKSGSIFFALAKTQLGQDFIESSVPTTGLGGFGPAAGEPYVAPARIFRFERVENRVVLRWPNTLAEVTPHTPQAVAALQSLPNSVIAVVPIVAEDQLTGTVVIPASPFLGDVAFYEAVFQSQIQNPLHGYHLDPSRTFFTHAKAFPQNDVLRVSQTWASSNPNLIDNAPDARSLEVGMTYNIVAIPNDGYMPRFADPRVGYFEQPLLDFARDRAEPRNIYYASRWNFGPQTGRPSNATHPLTFYISENVPVEYRDIVKQSLLQWNDAFTRIGILNAVRVEQQPEDPNWDPDDIRHNMVRWIDTTSPQYGAEALIISDPRTGEEVNVGINVDAVEGRLGRAYRYIVAPARGLPDSEALERAFTVAYLRGLVLHESGHDLGLQHNFIGSMAYTAKQLQNKAFTSKYGITTSVMEYAPINLWPKGTSQGDYGQNVLGPYDYYAIRYGYAYIPNARSPRDELPSLQQWASKWSDPRYRFASDEDAFFDGGHAIDPRVQQNDLTNDPLGWCDTQQRMMHNLMDAVDRRFPGRGHSYDEARAAFLAPLNYYLRCTTMAAHTIGGEYLSRANAGDPGATVPLRPVPKSEDQHAWQLLTTGLFSDAAWRFNPNVLNRLTYSEVSAFNGATWVYNPTARHDVPVVEIAALAQEHVLDEMFAPLTLERIDELPTKYARGATMDLPNLFDWTRAGIFGDIASGGVARSGVVRRNLQMRFTKRLAHIWTSPMPGTPPDAQALARLQLADLERDSVSALRRPGVDSLTRAHLEALRALAKQALDARAVIAPPAPPPEGMQLDPTWPQKRQ